MKTEGTNRPFKTPGFTLVELLVVMAIVVAMAGFAVRLLWQDDGAAARRAAQEMLLGITSAARAHAAVANLNTRIAVCADIGRSETCLRRLVIVAEEADGTWRFVGDGVLLPAGLRVVPATLPCGGLATHDGAAGSWPVKGKSSLTTAVQSLAQPGGGNWPGLYLLGPGFSPQGTLSTMLGANRLVAGKARADADGILFNDPGTLCGLTISHYGICTRIEDAVTFE